MNFSVLHKDLLEMESCIGLAYIINPGVSKVSVGWHLMHSFMVINGICDSLKRSNPKHFKPGYNFMRMLVFITGRFPRGKARAPKVVQPTGEATKEELRLQLEKVRRNLSEFDELQKNNYFIHPYFNQLNKPQSKRLLEIHSRHHLKIIRDILKKQ